MNTAEFLNKFLLICQKGLNDELSVIRASTYVGELLNSKRVVLQLDDESEKIEFSMEISKTAK